MLLLSEFPQMDNKIVLCCLEIEPLSDSGAYAIPRLNSFCSACMSKTQPLFRVFS